MLPPLTTKDRAPFLKDKAFTFLYGATIHALLDNSSARIQQAGSMCDEFPIQTESNHISGFVGSWDVDELKNASSDARLWRLGLYNHHRCGLLLLGGLTKWLNRVFLASSYDTRVQTTSDDW